MGYVTPHHAHEFMKAIALQVIHDYFLHFQRRDVDERKAILLSKREIDLHAMVLRFFGPEAALNAQGVAGIDLAVNTPRLDVEFKYLRKKLGQNQPVNSYADVMKDWNWLLNLVDERKRVFKRSCWVVFMPSIELFDFHSNFQVPGAQRRNGWKDKAFAPFVDMVESDGLSRLKYKKTQWYIEHKQRDVVLVDQATGKKVRRQLVGYPLNPLWCIIYSQVGVLMEKELDGLVRININS